MKIKELFFRLGENLKKIRDKVKNADYKKPLKKQTWVDILVWLKNKIFDCKNFVISNKGLSFFLTILLIWNIFLQLKTNNNANVINNLPSSYELYDIKSELRSDIDEIGDEIDEINNHLYDLQDRVKDLEYDSHTHMYY